MKKDVVLNEIKNELNLKERDIDKIVLKSYYNICKYYNKDIEIIHEYKKYCFYNWQLRI